MPDDVLSGHHRGRPGQQEVNLAQGSFIYDEAHYLLTAVDLSIVSCVAEATQQFPCLVLSLKLDISMVREPISRDEIYVADAPADGHSRQLISTSA